MTNVFDVAALGTRVRFAFDDDLPATTVEAVRSAWIDAALHTPGAPDAVVPVTAEREPDAMAERLTVEVTLAALRKRRAQLLMFHAAGVADARGRVAAFVGPSGRGKTTLSRTLGQHFGYVSDETVGAEPGGRVLSYRKPLSVVRRGAPKQQVAPRAFGLVDADDARLQLSAITILDRDAGVVAPTVEAVDFCDAVAEVVPQMSYLADLPTPLQTLAVTADRIGGFTRLRYSDAESVTPLVPGLLDHRREGEPWHAVPAPGGTVLGGRYTASPVLDAVRFGDRAVLFTGRRVQVLDGIAPAVWDALRAGHDLDGVVTAVTDEFGDPPHGDARAIVQSTLDQLTGEGILAGV
ncbi:PqqD family peptide modification chaperone [Microbacterium sp. Mu-80]|uniref:PqqD family peptide modification chaperone n=1 Tax=Microbacterium bandirmense TaxID=3122050 RepID=A0ABU8LEA8_9MICO